MNNFELRVQQNPGVIEMNFDEVSQYLDEKLSEYDGAVFTEASKDIAKKEVASLRKLRKDFEDSRKTVKKEWMKPYEAFEARAKELLAKIDKPIALIDEQVQAFEESRKEKKREEIRKIYGESIGEWGDYLPLERIYDQRWENATTTAKSIREAIQERVLDCEMSVASIKAMESEAEEKALALYKQSLSMPEAIMVINNYERQKAEILKREEEKRAQEAERQRLAEIERVRAEERAAIAREEQARKEAEEAKREAEQVNVAPPAEEIVTAFEQEISEDLPFPQVDTITAYYKVIATRAELDQFETALNSFGIFFERKDG